jgi:Porin subfamily
MEVEMKMVKSLLLGTAAGLVAVAGAQAADMPVKAKPVQYVKICSLYGDGFYYIPGTDTCLKLGGFLRVQGEYNGSGDGQSTGTGGNAAQGRFNRTDTNDFNARFIAAMSFDVRQQTEYGTLRTYMRFGMQTNTPFENQGGNIAAGYGTSPATFLDRAFIQFAGFTVGRAQSFFDLFTYGGGMSYHNVRVNGDTGAAGVLMWAYTAQFGNGVSGTLSVADPNSHGKAGTFDVTVPAFWGSVAAVNNNGLVDNAAVNGSGMRMPDVVANLRIDQAWGFVGLSGAVHDVSGAYYLTADNVNNGHPADKLGWSLAAGGQLNLPGGDQVGINFCYAQGASGYCTNTGAMAFSLWNAGTSTGFGWLSDGVFDTGTAIELTSVWSVTTGYQHIWNPKWRTAFGGGYVAVSYNGTAAGIIDSHTAGSLAACGVAAAPGVTQTAFAFVPGSSCNPNYSFYEIYTRTQWNPVQQLDIGVELLYTHLNTAFKGVAAVAASGAQPARGLIDDQNVWSAMVRWQRNFYP